MIYKIPEVCNIIFKSQIFILICDLNLIRDLDEREKRIKILLDYIIINSIHLRRNFEMKHSLQNKIVEFIKLRGESTPNINYLYYKNKIHEID